MDFTSRGSLSHQPPRLTTAPAPEMRPADHQKHRSKDDMLAFGSRIGNSILLIIVVILVALVAWFTVFSTPTSQGNYVDSSKLQAIFLNSGQVYFGNIKSLNSQYFVLTNVYYLQSNNSSTSSSSSNQNVSLVKLGCELHKPYDTMVVNSSQITFWENLQADGQVAKAVAQFEQQHPNGQTCSTSSSTNSSSNPQSQASVKP